MKMQLTFLSEMVIAIIMVYYVGVVVYFVVTVPAYAIVSIVKQVVAVLAIVVVQQIDVITCDATPWITEYTIAVIEQIIVPGQTIAVIEQTIVPGQDAAVDLSMIDVYLMLIVFTVRIPVANKLVPIIAQVVGFSYFYDYA